MRDCRGRRSEREGEREGGREGGRGRDENPSFQDLISIRHLRAEFAERGCSVLLRSDEKIEDKETCKIIGVPAMTVARAYCPSETSVVLKP